MSKTGQASGVPRKPLKVIARDTLLTHQNVASFFKFPRIEIVVVSAKPPTLDNYSSVTKEFAQEKKVRAVRLGDSFPFNLSDFCILDENDYYIGKALAQAHPECEKVFIVSYGLAYESEGNFKVTTFQGVHDYIRSYLGMPEVEKKERKKKAVEGSNSKPEESPTYDQEEQEAPRQRQVDDPPF